jgi:hypothetical protein
MGSIMVFDLCLFLLMDKNAVLARTNFSRDKTGEQNNKIAAAAQHEQK